MHKTNPMLQTPVWTFADMAVAQDWELECGNEGALIWTDLGPELARMVCENPEVLVLLTRVAVTPPVGAGARAGARAGEGAWARAGTGAWTWAWAGARAGAGARARARARVGSDSWVRTVAYAGNDYA